MSHFQKQALIWLLLGLSVAGGTWCWFEYMEQRWESTPVIRAESKGLPLAAATLFLQKYDYQVSKHDSLSEVLDQAPSKLPPGTLMLPIAEGVLTTAQSKQLLAWVAQGNTLITMPHSVSKSERFSRLVEHAAKEKKNADSIDADPILAHFGLAVKQRECIPCNARTHAASEASESDNSDDGEEKSADAGASDAHTSPNAQSDTTPEPKVEQVQSPASTPRHTPPSKRPSADNTKRNSTLIQFPHQPYRLELRRSHTQLVTGRERPSALFADEEGDTLRVYQEGRGQVVVMTHTPFTDQDLAEFDHAEILLNLVKLGAGKHLSIVRNTDMPRWYVALWNAFMLPLIGLGCLLILALWRAMLRFGSVLPEPHTERRSLIEHVEASGRWLWKIPGGRDLLLSAARSATDEVLKRRAPALTRMSLDAQMEQITQTTGIADAVITSAFLHRAADTPMIFTQQIHTLQQVRKHYEQFRR